MSQDPDHVPVSIPTLGARVAVALGQARPRRTSRNPKPLRAQLRNRWAAAARLDRPWQSCYCKGLFSLFLGQVMAVMRVAVCAALIGTAWGGTAREELVALRAKLAARRQGESASSWKALVQFAEKHAKDAELAAEVLYDVARSQRARGSGERYAAKTLAQLLKSHPKTQPWAALAAYDLAGLYAAQSSTRKEAIPLYAKFLAFEKGGRARRAKATLALAELTESASQPQDCLARYRAMVKEFPDFERLCARARYRIGSILAGLKQPKQAERAYEELSSEHPWDTEGRSSLLRSLVTAHRTAEDYEAAIAAAERYLKEFLADGYNRSQVYVALAAVHAQKKSDEAVAATYRRMADDPWLRASERVQGLRYLFAHYSRTGEQEATIRLAREIIAAHPSSCSADYGRVLGHLVDALIETDHIDEAIPMARAYYCISQLPTQHSGSRSTAGQEAIFSVVRALKAREGGLRGANAFIDFVTSGPAGRDGREGTADDIKNPLAAYRLPPDKARDAIFAAAARRFTTSPFELGYLYLCWDKPAEALKAFRRHYLAATSKIALQKAAALLEHAMRTVGRPESEVAAFFDFQAYGPNGKDRKPKTKDDLKDPVVGLK